jgi:hypothetical protein
MIITFTKGNKLIISDKGIRSWTIDHLISLKMNLQENLTMYSFETPSGIPIVPISGILKRGS